jgi:PKD repeat protein
MNQKPPLFRLDEQVFFTMAALCALSIIVLAFRFTTRTSCKPFSFIVSSETFTEGEMVRFKASAYGNNTYHWDFGDGAEKKERTPTTSHIYTIPGIYTVTLTLNGACLETQSVEIKKTTIYVEPTARIGSPDTAYVDERIQFRDESVGAKTWEWAFESDGQIDATNKNPVYVYTTTGLKTVSLRINERPDLTTTKAVMVIKRSRVVVQEPTTTRPPRSRPVPPPVNDIPVEEPLQNPTDTPAVSSPAPVEPAAPPVATEVFAVMLKDVMNGTKSTKDFSSYLCNNLSIEVKWGDKTMPFDEFCLRLAQAGSGRRAKRISIKQLTKSSTNCIKSLTVKVERKDLIGRYHAINP